MISSTLVINEKKYCLVRDVPSSVSYSPDYISRLARERKINAVQIGRQWFVNLDSLAQYAALQQQEQAIRQKHLRRERQFDRLIAVNATVTTQSKPVRYYRAIVLSGGMVVAGVMFGLVTQHEIRDAAMYTASLSQSTIDPVLSPQSDAEALPARFFYNPTIVHVTTDRVIDRPATDGWIHN